MTTVKPLIYMPYSMDLGERDTEPKRATDKDRAKKIPHTFKIVKTAKSPLCGFCHTLR